MRRTLLVALGLLVASSSASAQARFDRHGDPLPEGASARLGTLRLRHPLADRIWFTPDGQAIVTCGDDDTIRVWDALSGNLLHKRRRPYLLSQLNVVSADGNLHLTQNGQDVLEVWDLRVDRCLGKLELKDVSSFSVGAFSLDGKSVATADDTPREHRLRIWELETGKHRVVGIHEGRVTELLFTPDGKGLISASSEEKLVCRWTVPGGKEAWRIDGEYGRLALSADGRTLVGWTPYTSNLPPGLFDAATGKPLDLPAKPEPRPYGFIEVAPDGKTLLLSGHEGIEVWDATEGRVVAKRPSAFAAAFTPDGQSYATLRGVLQGWELKTGKPVYPDGKAWGHISPVAAVAWSPDGKSLATSSPFESNDVRLWDATTGKLLRTWDFEANTLTFTPDERELIFAGPTLGAFSRRDVAEENPRVYFDFDPGADSGHRLFTLALSPGGKRVVALHSARDPKHTLHVSTFDLFTGRRLSTWDTEMNFLLPRGLSPDARFFAGKGRVFEAATGRELPSLEAVEGKTPTDPGAFSPDGSLVAGGFRRRVRTGQTRSEDRTEDLAVWERATGRLIRQFPTGAAGHCAFLPDGRTLVAATPDGLRGWDVGSGEQTFFRKAHDRGTAFSGDSFALCLAISPDGRRVATGHLDMTALIWELPPPPKPNVKPLSDAERDALWTDLAGADAAKAYAARCRLTEAFGQVLPWLRERLQPVKARTAADLKAELAELDAEQFRRRETAAKRLLEVGDAAVPVLREALRGELSAEKRQRIETVLTGLEWKTAPHGEDLRHIRAVTLLERVGSREARQLLETLAGGAESARVTVEARAALERLAPGR